MLQYRNFCITINNEPMEDDEFFEYCKNLVNVKYFVFQREIGHENQTRHIQMYIEFSQPKKFETIKSYFPRAHIEERRGTKKQAREYCMKEDTSVAPYREYGQFVDNGKRSDLLDIYELVKDGATDFDIMERYPMQFMRYSKAIQKCREVYVSQKFRGTFRHLEVKYIWGPTGCGKSRYVIDKYGYENVYRVTNYDKGPFDTYAGEDVIVFEEFRSSFKIVEMLNYLDGYSFELPCRFSNRTACYTKVFISTNIPLSEQYKTLQVSQKETWQAFLRRINFVYHFDKREDKESIQGFTPEQVLNDSRQIMLEETDLELYDENGNLMF